LAEALKSFEYSRISLSSEIKKVWAEKNQKKVGAVEQEPLRKDLQDIGNELRQSRGSEYLAKKAVEAADQLPSNSLVVFDGIRNAAEVDYLRETFPNFFLITVWCPQEKRWERIKDQYKESYTEFVNDDNRDRNEEIEYGQQVQLCVDKADIVIRNDEPHHSKEATKKAMQGKIKEYIDLLGRKTVRIPHHDEMAMTLAYTSSLRSMCLKRTVGAVITNRSGIVISTGYNENPEPLPPCLVKFKYCYKDSCLKEHFASLINRRTRCPYCHQELTDSVDYKCTKCSKNLIPAFSPDRGMSRCTAIHAENMAIMNASGRNLKDTILYTTTFPCSQCARQIVFAGISEVVYTEPYPDQDSARFLVDLTGIKVRMFEGVKARAFDRVFTNVRQENEKKYSLST
jgi:deoxycytidylate deaminase